MAPSHLSFQKTELGVGQGEPYLQIQALEELHFFIQGIHFGVKLYLAHVSRVHILKESRGPLILPFLEPR